MQFRFSILEIIIIIVGLLVAGIILGMMISGKFTFQNGFYALGLSLFSSLTLIIRRRYKILKK